MRQLVLIGAILASSLVIGCKAKRSRIITKPVSQLGLQGYAITAIEHPKVKGDSLYLTQSDVAQTTVGSTAGIGVAAVKPDLAEFIEYMICPKSDTLCQEIEIFVRGQGISMDLPEGPYTVKIRACVDPFNAVNPRENCGPWVEHSILQSTDNTELTAILSEYRTAVIQLKQQCTAMHGRMQQDLRENQLTQQEQALLGNLTTYFTPEICASFAESIEAEQAQVTAAREMADRESRENITGIILMGLGTAAGVAGLSGAGFGYRQALNAKHNAAYGDIYKASDPAEWLESEIARKKATIEKFTWDPSLTPTTDPKTNDLIVFDKNKIRTPSWQQNRELLLSATLQQIYFEDGKQNMDEKLKELWSQFEFLESHNAIAKFEAAKESKDFIKQKNLREELIHKRENSLKTKGKTRTEIEDLNNQIIHLNMKLEKIIQQTVNETEKEIFDAFDNYKTSQNWTLSKISEENYQTRETNSKKATQILETFEEALEEALKDLPNGKTPSSFQLQKAARKMIAESDDTTAVVQKRWIDAVDNNIAKQKWGRRGILGGLVATIGAGVAVGGYYVYTDDDEQSALGLAEDTVEESLIERYGSDFKRILDLGKQAREARSIAYGKM